MTTLSAIILAGWYATILAKAVCLAVLLRRHLAARYLAFSILLAVGLAKSLWLAWSFMTAGNHGYRSAWIASQCLAIVLYAAVTLEAFYLQARHFPGIRWFAITLATMFTAISAVLTVATAGIGLSHWSGLAQRLVLMTRYYTLACLVMIVLAWSFFRIFPNVRLRENVRCHVRMLALLLLGEVLVTGSAYATAGAWMPAAQLVAAVWPLACYLAWSVKMRRAGEVFEGIRVEPVLTAQEIRFIRETVQREERLP